MCLQQKILPWQKLLKFSGLDKSSFRNLLYQLQKTSLGKTCYVSPNISASQGSLQRKLCSLNWPTFDRVHLCQTVTALVSVSSQSEENSTSLQPIKLKRKPMKGRSPCRFPRFLCTAAHVMTSLNLGPLSPRSSW